jgi:hypothetical protein
MVLCCCSSSIAGGISIFPRASEEESTQESTTQESTQESTQEPETSTTPVEKNGITNVRYVRIERPSAAYPANIINLAELEIIDKNGNNVAKGKSVTAAPGVHSAGPLVNLTDGNFSNFAHTHGDGKSYMEIDLGSPMTIQSEVIITNRKNCCQERTQNMKVKFLDANKAVIFETKVVEKSKTRMQLDFSSTSTPEWTY